MKVLFPYQEIVCQKVLEVEDSILIYGERGSGKTTILKAIEEKLKKEEGTLVAYVSLEVFPIHRFSFSKKKKFFNFLGEILRRLAVDKNLIKKIGEQDFYFLLQELFRQEIKRITILLDESDILLKQWPQEIQQYLRGCINTYVDEEERFQVIMAARKNYFKNYKWRMAPSPLYNCIHIFEIRRS